MLWLEESLLFSTAYFLVSITSHLCCSWGKGSIYFPSIRYIYYCPTQAPTKRKSFLPIYLSTFLNCIVYVLSMECNTGYRIISVPKFAD